MSGTEKRRSLRITIRDRVEKEERLIQDDVGNVMIDDYKTQHKNWKEEERGGDRRYFTRRDWEAVLPVKEKGKIWGVIGRTGRGNMVRRPQKVNEGARRNRNPQKSFGVYGGSARGGRSSWRDDSGKSLSSTHTGPLERGGGTAKTRMLRKAMKETGT